MIKVYVKILQVNQQFSNLHLGGAGPSLPTMSQPLSSWSQQPGHLPEVSCLGPLKKLLGMFSVLPFLFLCKSTVSAAF